MMVVQKPIDEEKIANLPIRKDFLGRVKEICSNEAILKVWMASPSRPPLEVLTMEHIVTQPSDTVIDITCDVCCKNTSVKGYGQKIGTLQEHWGTGYKQEGERKRT